jgi:hypothetical protein
MKIQHSLLRLYPHTWRERYEDELLAMLEQRSLSFTDGVGVETRCEGVSGRKAQGSHSFPALPLASIEPECRFRQSDATK